MQRLREYIRAYAIRGACTCGLCYGGPENPEQHQPEGHTVDLTFFKVAAANGADANVFRALVQEALPECFDGQEHNYIELGAKLGDQGCALSMIGVGHVLGIWSALSPETVLGAIVDEKLKRDMAGMGMVALLAKR